MYFPLDIPVGMGTNRNENIHRQLRSFVRNKLGVETAKALVTHIFYAHNMKSTNNIVPPIWSHAHQTRSTMSTKACVQYQHRVNCTESVDDFYNSIEVERFDDHDYCSKNGKLLLFSSYF